MVQFEITQHRLVPKHSIVNDAEKKEILEQYRVTLKELPKILATDPIAEHLKAKAGDIIKIIRSSRTAGESVYYRVVIRG